MRTPARATDPSPLVVRRRSAFLGLAFVEKAPEKRPRLRFRWGRILFIGVGASLLAYLCGALVLYYFYKYEREFEEVRFTRVLVWPFQRAVFRREMGEYFIREGRALLEAGYLYDGFHYLRNGVARAPANLEGRVILAELFEHGVRRVDMAAEILEGGLPYARQDRDYLKRLLNLLLRYQRDVELERLVAQILPLEDPGNSDRDYFRLAAFSAANASFFRGGYDSAEELVHRYRLETEPEGVRLLSEIHWRRNQRDEAFALLEEGLRQFPNNDDIHLSFIRFHRKAGDMDRARRTALQRVTARPRQIGPRIEMLHVYRHLEDADREATEIESLLREYFEDDSALRLLAGYAGETGQPALADRLYRMSLDRGMDVAFFALMAMEARVAAGEHQDAMLLADQLTAEGPLWLTSWGPTFDGLRAVSYYGGGRVDLGQHYLRRLLAEENLRAELLLATTRRLLEVDRLPQALQILETAYRANPANQAILTSLAELEMSRGPDSSFPELIDRMLDLSHPDREVLKQAYRLLGSDRFLLDESRDGILIRLRQVLDREPVPRKPPQSLFSSDDPNPMSSSAGG